VLHDDVSYLLDLIWLCFSAFRLNIEDFVYAVLRKYEVTAPDALSKTEASKYGAKLIEPDMRIRRSAQDFLQDFLFLRHKTTSDCISLLSLLYRRRGYRSSEEWTAQGIDISITNGYTIVMKTAISVPDDVFHEVDKVAKERHSSRSEVIVAALREYLERRRSSNMLKVLNETYGTAETTEEYEVRQKAKNRYSKTLGKERS
jgi:predicted transcriptional regulator